MKRKSQLVKVSAAVVLLLAGVFVIGSFRFGAAYDRAWAEAHQLTRQRTHFSGLISVLELWYIEDHDALRLEMPGEGPVAGSKLINLVRHAERPESTAGNRAAEGYLIDEWGHPVQFYFRRPIGTNCLWEVELRSFGPNGRDESGSGDDIELRALVGRR